MRTREPSPESGAACEAGEEPPEPASPVCYLRQFQEPGEGTLMDNRITQACEDDAPEDGSAR